jgi:hypothetical protein
MWITADFMHRRLNPYNKNQYPKTLGIIIYSITTITISSIVMTFHVFIQKILKNSESINYTKIESDDLWIILMLSVFISFITILTSKFFNYNIKSLLSSQASQYNFIEANSLHKVSSVSNDKISNYPRFTIYIDDETNEREQMIFDSSDFEIINKAFGTDKQMQPILANNRYTFFRNKKYYIKKMNVDMMSLFDDYSSLGHTSIYEGEATPYNIQIVMYLTKANDELFNF